MNSTATATHLPNEAEPDDDAWTPDDVATRLKVSRKLAFAWMRAAGARELRGGRDLRISKRKMLAWLDREKRS